MQFMYFDPLYSPSLKYVYVSVFIYMHVYSSVCICMHVYVYSRVCMSLQRALILKNTAQCCPLEPSVMLEMFYICTVF